MEPLNISNTRHCYGCGICAIVCGQNIIKIELNGEGFYEPNLFDEGACTHCGLCLSVCAYDDDNLLNPNEGKEGYAAWSNDIQVRKKCTSGGISFELGKLLIREGYKACGVRYNPEMNRAEHFMASSITEFIPSIGSKYIQSYTPDGFLQLNRNDRFFVTGTPCQIDSIRRYIRKLKIEDNFVLMDFFCHGVPSLNMWKKYTEMVENKIGKITYASWRNKIIGWHDSVIVGLDGVNEDQEIRHDDYSMAMRHKTDFTYLSLCKEGDLFYEFFLADNCLGRACYDKCKYKIDKSAADIRVGDLWGGKYKNNHEGVSGLIVFTEKGRNILSALGDCTIIKEDLDVVTKIQQKVSPKKKYVRKYLLKAFASNLSMEDINKLYQIYLLPGRVINKLLNVLNSYKRLNP